MPKSLQKQKMMEARENHKLLELAVARLKDFDPNTLVDEKTLMEKYGINEEDIEAAMQQVALE